MSQESFPNDRFGSPCTLLDPACDPDNPIVVAGETILDATHRIKHGIVRTPCSVSTRISLYSFNQSEFSIQKCPKDLIWIYI